MCFTSIPDSKALKEPLFAQDDDFHFLSREQQFERGLRKGKRLWEFAIEYGCLTPKDIQYLLMYVHGTHAVWVKWDYTR